jgi:hypothetical protein
MQHLIVIDDTQMEGPIMMVYGIKWTLKKTDIKE